MIKIPSSQQLKSSNSRFLKINFLSVMQLYSENFNLLRQLFDLQLLENDFQLISSKTAEIIHISNIENSRYSTIFNMSYSFSQPKENIPNAKIKIYKDSHQAEILAIKNFNQVKSFASLTRLKNLNNIKAKWELNLFLQRWLDYILANQYQIKPG